MVLDFYSPLPATEQTAMPGHTPDSIQAVCDNSPVHRTLISCLAGSENVNWTVCCVHSSPLIRLQFAYIFQMRYLHCWLEFHLHKPHEALKRKKKNLCTPDINHAPMLFVLPTFFFVLSNLIFVLSNYLWQNSY